MRTIFCGNLNYMLTDAELRAAFEPYGRVVDARIITDRFTGDSKGFGFVEMGSDEEAQKAMTALDGSRLMGRTLRCNSASPREGR